MTDSALRRYERPREESAPRRERIPPIPAADCAVAIEASAISPGAKALANGLLELASIRVFGGADWELNTAAC